jgi:hypothetical protein
MMRNAVATYGHPFLSMASTLKAQDAGQWIALGVPRWNVTRRPSGEKARVG